MTNKSKESRLSVDDQVADCTREAQIIVFRGAKARLGLCMEHRGLYKGRGRVAVYSTKGKMKQEQRDKLEGLGNTIYEGPERSCGETWDA